MGRNRNGVYRCVREHRQLCDLMLSLPCVGSNQWPPGHDVKLPELSQLPDQIANSIQRFRETLAGKFVFHLYREHERVGQEYL